MSESTGKCASGLYHSYAAKCVREGHPGELSLEANETEAKISFTFLRSPDSLRLDVYYFPFYLDLGHLLWVLTEQLITVT